MKKTFTKETKLNIKKKMINKNKFSKNKDLIKEKAHLTVNKFF